MIPYLFPNDAISFEGMGYGALTRAVSCQVRQELGSTGVYELNMEILTDDPNFKNMEIGKIIVAKPNFTDVNQAFVIESMSKPINNVVSVYATHIAQHRARLIPVSPVNATSLSDAITKIAANSQETNPFTLHTSRTVNVAYKTVKPMSFREILGGTQGSLLDVYGGEYIFNNLDIELVNKRGRTNGIQVVYGQNMTDFKLDEDFSYSKTITGILPYWYSEDDGLVQGSVQYSDYVNYFKYHKTVAKDYTDKFENKPTAAELESMAATEVKYTGYPSVNMAISFNDFNKVIKGDTKIMQLGDTVKVINSNYMVNTEARIVSMLFNVLADRYDEIQVGSLSQSINEAISDTFPDVNVSGGVTYTAGTGIDITNNVISSKGIIRESLWTNSSPDSSFAAQTIPLSLSSYKMVLIDFRLSTNYTARIMYPYLPNGYTRVANGIFSDGNIMFKRNLTVSSTGIQFYAGYQGTTQSNINMVPEQIWGIK